jgi:hypothetical protein
MGTLAAIVGFSLFFGLALLEGALGIGCYEVNIIKLAGLLLGFVGVCMRSIAIRRENSE